MADNMFFSRDTKFLIRIGSDVWELTILDGFSFSQATNTTEVTLNEMSSGSNNSRRGRKMFTDSYAPAEWSFSTYARPFKSAGSGTKAASGISGDTHAVEEVLWALMVGDAAYASSSGSGAVTAIDGIVVPSALASADKFGADQTTGELQTTTDGGGSGATVTVTYTESSGAFSVTIGSEKGSNYNDDDKLFISREVVFDALKAGDADAPTLVTDFDADFEVSVNGVGTGDSGTSFTGFTRDGTDLDIDFNSSNKTTLGPQTAAGAEFFFEVGSKGESSICCLLYTSPSPRDS